MAAVAGAHDALSSSSFPLLIGSWGATAVLLFAAPLSPLSQPRNVLGGHALSALVGVGVRMAIVEQGGAPVWLGAALSVSLAIAAMMGSGTLHPPGGATALIAVIGDAALRRLQLMYVLVPALAGAAIMLAVALVLNNVRWGRQGLEKGCQWPMRWR